MHYNTESEWWEAFNNYGGTAPLFEYQTISF